ncbi:hypothetical protein HY490_04995 [Candidatus Woesearchaeota archaeon]|nr:hypothetical protein [Candidatus Woesearchaeota archaeon]
MNKQAYVITILLIGLAFVFGTLFGGAYRTRQFDQVTEFLKKSELATESYLLEQELLEGLDVNCGLATSRLTTLSTDLYELGKLLGGPTAREDLGDTQYRFLKRKFHLMQLQTYVLHLKLRKNCNMDAHVVLFYFAQGDNASTEQGKILDSLVPYNALNVFAIEYNYSSELRFIEEYYNITTTPSIVLDYEKKFDGLADARTLEPYLS